MSFSILIPVFNAAEHLAATLDSIVPQLKSEDEIILVDDHSSDSSIQVIQDFFANHSANHFIGSNPSKGACSARNYAFKRSSGDFIIWLDADDLMGPNRLDKLRNLNKREDRAIHACPWFPFNHTTTNRINPNVDWESIPMRSTPADWIARDTYMNVHCYAANREIFVNAGPWDESLAINQDGEYFTRAIACCKEVLFDPSCAVFYRREGGGVSKFSHEKAVSLFRSTHSMARTALEIEDSQRMRQMISNRWQHFIYTAYPHTPELRHQAQALLKELPRPTLSNPQTVSRTSKLFSSIFGWKSLMRIRKLRGRP